MSSIILHEQSTSPAAPDTNKRRLFTRGGILWERDSSGTEKPVNLPSFASATALQALRLNSGKTALEFYDAGIGAPTTTITTATTLTASQAYVPVAMSTDSQSITLPSATGLGTGSLRIIENVGNRTFGVRNNAGVLLTAVEAGGVAEVYLRDNGTAAGQWTVSGRGLAPALTILDHTMPTTLTQTVDVAVRLTDTLSLHFARNASGHPFVFAVDHSTAPATVGTAVLITAASRVVRQAFRISSTKALVVWEFGGTTTVTVSGTTCTLTAGATAAVFDTATFTGAPQIAPIGANGDFFVGIDLSAGAIRAQAVDASGSAATVGSSVNIVGSGGQAVIGVYRISDTTALALYVDDSGSAGDPFSIRGVVLSLSGTTITVGTSAGLNDVVSNFPLPSVQLSATSYVISYYQAAGGLVRAVHVGVSGTTVTFGTPLTVETLSLPGLVFDRANANRFQPNLFALSATTALMTYAGTSGSVSSRHVVITNNAGTLTAGTILHNTWVNADGGNFPQASDGFLALADGANASNFSNENIYAITVSGTNLVPTGAFNIPGGVFSPQAQARFGLSGGVRGVRQATNTLAGLPVSRFDAWHLFRFAANAAPRYLGQIVLNNYYGEPQRIPVELSPNKAAFTAVWSQRTGINTDVGRLLIVEFAA